jgi:hypothetical protein
MEENELEDDAVNEMDRDFWIWCKDSGSGDGSFECGGIHVFSIGVDELLRSIFFSALDFPV